MPSRQTTILERLLGSTARPLSAETLAEFLVGVRRGHEAIYRALVESSDSEAGLAALDEAFAGTRRLPRHRRILELCAWPVFEKPAMPLTEGALPEFLWLFAVPVLAQLPLQRESILMAPADLLRTAEFIDVLEDSGCLNEKAIVSGFSALYTRDDLHAFGPRSIAERFVLAEAGEDFDIPTPLPVVRDLDIESGRTVTFYVLLAARLPVGEQELFKQDVAWPREQLDLLLAQDLGRAGLQVERLESEMACSMSETLYRCLGPGLREMERWVDLGQQHYSLASVYLTLPADGMAELVGTTEQGEELLLSSTFSYVEPSAELSACCAHICKERRIPFKGMFVSAAPTSSALH
jgi:hypothetical protein